MVGSVETMLLPDNGWVPNNPLLPVLLYRRSVPRDAAQLEAVLARHGWPAQWHGGVYPYHHYHSTAHELLGCVRGAARVALGGPDGGETVLTAGDAMVLPCGTGHCRISASVDFLVVGAYPDGQDWDLCRSAPSPEMLAGMRQLPYPICDPVIGPGGPLPTAWTQA